MAAGCQLGFRKMTATPAGTWVAKYRADDGKRATKSLGEFEDLPKSQRYDAAAKAARAWFEHMGKDGARTDATVQQACERYVAFLRPDFAPCCGQHSRLSAWPRPVHPTTPARWT